MIIGKKTVIWKGNISNDLIIGDNCSIGALCNIDKDVMIGNNTRVQSQVFMPPKTRIGNNVFIAPQVGFSNDHYPPSKVLQGVTVEDDVIIGFGSKIIGGITIGKGSIIGMGSIVTKDIPPFEVWYGNPAKRKYTSSKYWNKKKVFDNG